MNAPPLLKGGKLPKSSLPALQWRDVGIIATKQGSKHLFTASIPDGWWDYWKQHKDKLKSLGVSCGKDKSGSWHVTHWTALDDSAAAPAPVAFSNGRADASKADAPTASFTPTVPSGVTPFPYQSAGVEYCLPLERAIIGDDMGLGKTLQAIMVCNP
jgi:hypothetical protein